MNTTLTDTAAKINVLAFDIIEKLSEQIDIIGWKTPAPGESEFIKETFEALKAIKGTACEIRRETAGILTPTRAAPPERLAFISRLETLLIEDEPALSTIPADPAECPAIAAVTEELEAMDGDAEIDPFDLPCQYCASPNHEGQYCPRVEEPSWCY